MKLLERFENVKQVWALAMPTIPLPPNETIMGWLACYEDSEFENAVIRVPHRMRQGRLGKENTPPEEIYKLISSFLYEMKKVRRRQEQAREGRALAMGKRCIEAGITPEQLTQQLAAKEGL